METYNLYATKKGSGYELIGNIQTQAQARKKAERLSTNEYTSYLIVRKSKELGDTPVEKGNIEDLDKER